MRTPIERQRALRKQMKEEERLKKREEEEEKRYPQAERAMFRTFMNNLPREITIDETKILAKLFIKHPEAMRMAMEAAHAAFTANAEHYINLHLRATRAAYAADEFDVAARHAEWAIERIGTKDVPLLQTGPAQAAPSSSGPKVLVAVQMGGLKPPDEIE